MSGTLSLFYYYAKNKHHNGWQLCSIEHICMENTQLNVADTPDLVSWISKKYTIISEFLKSHTFFKRGTWNPKTRSLTEGKQICASKLEGKNSIPIWVFLSIIKINLFPHAIYLPDTEFYLHLF